MKELLKATGGLELPKTMQSGSEGSVLIPKEPLDVRANLKGGDLRFKIGSSSESEGDAITMQILNYKKWKQIQISEKRPKLGDYIQLIGLVDLFGKRIFATVTMSGFSAEEAESKLPLIHAKSNNAGLAGMITKIEIKPENSNGNDWGLCHFSSRQATKDEFSDVIALLEETPNAFERFRELPNYASKADSND